MIQAKRPAPLESTRIADTRNEIDMLDEVASFVMRHHDVLASEQRHVLGLQDRPDETHLRQPMRTHANAVDVPATIHLHGAAEAEADVAALERPLARIGRHLSFASEVAQHGVVLRIR